MKKMMQVLLSSALALGGAVVLTQAANVHAAGTDATAGVTTKTDLTVNAGDLAMTAPAAVTFGDVSVEAAFNDDLSKTGTSDDELQATVTDFLGDNQPWTLTVQAAGWMLDKQDAGELNTDEQPTLMVNDAAVTTQPVRLATNSALRKNVPLTFTLATKAGTTLRAGQYTNTLDWYLNNVPAQGVQ